jgi:hypothetical protein
MPINKQVSHQDLSVNPARHAKLITASDSVDLDYVTKGFMVNAAGNVSVEMELSTEGDATVVLTCLSGQIYPIRVRRINATSTTATGIIAFW